MRVALGAGRARAGRLLLAESLLLSGMSAVLGIAFAAWLFRLAISAAPPTMQLGDIVSLSAWLALFAVGLTLCTGLLAGLWPALRGSRTNLGTSGLSRSTRPFPSRAWLRRSVESFGNSTRHFP